MQVCKLEGSQAGSIPSWKHNKLKASQFECNRRSKQLTQVGSNNHKLDAIYKMEASQLQVCKLEDHKLEVSQVGGTTK